MLAIRSEGALDFLGFKVPSPDTTSLFKRKKQANQHAAVSHLSNVCASTCLSMKFSVVNVLITKYSLQMATPSFLRDHHKAVVYLFFFWSRDLTSSRVTEKRRPFHFCLHCEPGIDHVDHTPSLKQKYLSFKHWGDEGR